MATLGREMPWKRRPNTKQKRNCTSAEKIRAKKYLKGMSKGNRGHEKAAVARQAPLGATKPRAGAANKKASDHEQE